MGMLLGPIMLFWLWERSVSRRQRVGIVSGVCANIVFSVFNRWAFPNRHTATKRAARPHATPPPGVRIVSATALNATAVLGTNASLEGVMAVTLSGSNQ